MATFYTHPSQNITAPHLYSSLQFSPCFILSYQTSSLPLFFSLLTLYQRYFDHQVSVLAPEQPRFLCPAFPQPRGCCSATLPSSSIATFAAISCPLPKVFSLLVNGVSAPSLPHVTSMNWFFCSYPGTSSFRYLPQFTSRWSFHSLDSSPSFWSGCCFWSQL